MNARNDVLCSLSGFEANTSLHHWATLKQLVSTTHSTSTDVNGRLLGNVVEGLLWCVSNVASAINTVDIIGATLSLSTIVGVVTRYEVPNRQRSRISFWDVWTCLLCGNVELRKRNWVASAKTPNFLSVQNPPRSSIRKKFTAVTQHRRSSQHHHQ